MANQMTNEKPLGATSVSTEIIAGITTFLTMAYIIFVHPDMLSKTGMDKTALIIVTCLVSGAVTILTGLITKTPIAMAPGMGLNGFFAFTLVLGEGIPWQTALGIVFVSGVIFLILSVVGLREKLVEAIPKDLLSAIAVGIGIFIAFMGIQNLKLVQADPNTLVKAGELTETVLIGLGGLLVMIVLEMLRIKGALLIGILAATVVSVFMGHAHLPDKIISFDLDIMPIFGQIDIIGALKISMIAPIFTMLFIDLFDSVGSLLGLARDAGLMDKDGKIPKIKQLLNIDACATVGGSICGTSTVTTYIESASGIAAGGRTGLTSVVTGSLFLLAILLVPVLSIVPSHATAPALIMVGFFMIKNILNIDFKKMDTGFPSFIIIIMIALCYSISTGLAFGFIAYTLLKVFGGKWKEVKPAMWVITVMCVLFFVV